MCPWKLLDWDSIDRSCGPSKHYEALEAECELLALMHSILRQQSPDDLLEFSSTSSAELRSRLKENEQRLAKWVSRHPLSDRLDHGHDATRFLNTLRSSNLPQEKSLLRSLFLYHRASLFLHCPWIAPLSALLSRGDEAGHDSTGTISRMRAHCLETSIESAMAIIHVSNHLALPCAAVDE